ncbi:MAG TPA: hypothetical protein PKI59_05095 [Candidatus Cloacimonadota bacterium]|nr:hypothetical protein [Candidatus Cloacimonadota bacterium]
MKRYIILLLIVLLASAALAATVRTKVMSFDNPGNRRLLKTDAGNYYYYRSLPEKSMTLNTAGVEKIQLRSFGIEAIRKPQVTIIIGENRTTYDLKLKERLNGFYLYEPLEFEIPANTPKIEVLCYNRSIYLRSFQLITVVPKPKPVTIPNRVINAHAGMIDIMHNSTTSDYYTFNAVQPLKFTLNNSRNAVVYVRARLTDRSLPSFSLYHNGVKVESHEFSLKRTTKYSAPGVKNLTVGIKLNLPVNSGSGEYELRADTDHLFMARPVLLKK